MRERVDATRDKPYRQATAARGAREPDRDAVLSSERVERGAHIISGANKVPYNVESGPRLPPWHAGLHLGWSHIGRARVLGGRG